MAPGDTWIGAAERPLPFDAAYKPKPAVEAIINTLLNTSVHSTARAEH